MIGGVASGLAAQSSVSRLMYAIGRDNVLPRRVSGYLHLRFRTPVFNLALGGIVGLLALKLSLSTSPSFINLGAFTAFTMVSVISYFIRRRRAGERLGVVGYAVVPVDGAVVNMWLLSNLDANAVQLGLGWLAIGVVYLVVLTRGFRIAAGVAPGGVGQGGRHRLRRLGSARGRPAPAELAPSARIDR